MQGWRQSAPGGHSPSISSFVPLNMLPRGLFYPLISGARSVHAVIKSQTPLPIGKRSVVFGYFCKHPRARKTGG